MRDEFENVSQCREKNAIFKSPFCTYLKSLRSISGDSLAETAGEQVEAEVPGMDSIWDRKAM